ncbi:hypothetical protein D6D04_04002 [Aureobasidium pullulans]|nr:hypothetical protein D6D04_04002 [Aureobasidium pullulans]
MPTCGHCLSRNRECVFESRSDKRRSVGDHHHQQGQELTQDRRISTRKSVKLFSARVKQLQDFIVSHGLPVPPPPGRQNASTLDNLMETYPSSPSEGQPDDPMDSGLLMEPSMNSLRGSETVQLNNQSTHTDVTMLGMDSSYPVSASTIPNDVSTQFDWSNDVAFDSLPTTGADWVWNAPGFDIPFADSNLDGPTASALMDLYASASGRPVPEISDALAGWDPETDFQVEEEDHTEVTSQISERMGGLLASKGGKWRFYGATSNLHLARLRSTPSSVPTKCLQQVTLNSSRLKLLGLDIPVEPVLEQRLIDLFFAWHNSSMHVVDKECFERGRSLYTDDHRDSEFYSEFLVNAICAVGAALESDRHPALPVPLPDFFSKRAKALLELELDEPKVATVQGLAIMSCHEVSFMQDTRAWLYSGMAVRLAFDLGLHISTQKYVDEGSMSHEESNARNIAVWGCFMNDRDCGLYLGRPFHSNIKDLASDLPIVNNTHESTSMWTAVMSGGSAPENVQPLLNAQNPLMEKSIALHLIMSSLGHQLYASENTTNLELQRLAHDTFAQLRDWRENLPTELDLDMTTLETTKTLPHILVLHMHYALLVIILHRPFCSRYYVQPRPLVGRGPQHAREMCIQSAVDIAKLLVCYKRQYTLRRISNQAVHTTFTAALILVYAVVSGIGIASQFRESLESHLDTTCEALSELGEAFPNANRALDVLLAAKRSWQARMLRKV